MDIQKSEQNIFDQMRRTHNDGSEFWSARDLMVSLGYSKWENFQQAITRAIESCENSENPSQLHFPGSRKMVSIGSGSTREILDYQFTRYAAYLVAMNSDPSKAAVALAQRYFFQQTRRAELAQTLPELPNDPMLAQLQMMMTLRTEQLTLSERTSVIESTQAQLVQRLDNTPIRMDSVMTSEISKLCQDLGRVHPGAWPGAYRSFKEAMGEPGIPLARYDALPIRRFDEARRWLELQIESFKQRRPLTEHWDREPP